MKMRNVSDGKPVENPPSIVRKTLAYNDEAMPRRFFLKEGSCIPLHSHRATQIGYVIAGKAGLIAEQPEDEFEVEAGDSYVFNSFVQHGTDVLEDAECVEVFVPAQDEYKDF
jgi:quercetin dioxygenase-like cupin family protein